MATSLEPCQAVGVAARVQRWEGPAPAAAEVSAGLEAEGLVPHGWVNGPGDTYDWHRHAYRKVLFCVRGGITFHLRDEEDVVLGPGDRLEIDAGTDHAATVGAGGVQCLEARA